MNGVILAKIIKAAFEEDLYLSTQKSIKINEDKCSRNTAYLEFQIEDSKPGKGFMRDIPFCCLLHLFGQRKISIIFDVPEITEKKNRKIMKFVIRGYYHESTREEDDANLEFNINFRERVKNILRGKE